MIAVAFHRFDRESSLESTPVRFLMGESPLCYT